MAGSQCIDVKKTKTKTKNYIYMEPSIIAIATLRFFF